MMKDAVNRDTETDDRRTDPVVTWTMIVFLLFGAFVLPLAEPGWRDTALSTYLAWQAARLYYEQVKR